MIGAAVLPRERRRVHGAGGVREPNGGTAWESFAFIVRGHGAGRRYRVAVEFEANGRRNIAMRGAGRGIATAVAAAALVTATSAAAHTYVVTKRSDPTPNGCHRHNCSLREAIL